MLEKIEAVETNVLESSELDEAAKIDARESAETIKAQLRRKAPGFSIVYNAWLAFQDVAVAESFSSAIKEVSVLLEKIAQD